MAQETTVAKQRVIEKSEPCRIEVMRRGEWMLADKGSRFASCMSTVHRADFAEMFGAKAWRIVRISDDVILAQSKTESTEPAAPDDSDNLQDRTIELQVWYRGEKWTQYGSNWGHPFSDYGKLLEKTRKPSLMIAKKNVAWRIVAYNTWEEYAHGNFVTVAQSKNAPVADSDPVIAAYELAGSNPLIAQMLLIDTIPTTDGMENVVILDTPAVKITALGVPVGTVQPANKVTGHGRKSRNRKNAPNRANNAPKRRAKANKVSTVMMERRTPEALKWREKRALANAVAMPIPTITGHELLTRAQGLQVLPRLTTTLERKRAA